MAFLALKFDVDAGAAERWGDALLAAGALSVDIADPHAGTSSETPLYSEPGMPVEPLWPVSRLTALFASESDPGSALQSAQAQVGARAPPHEIHPVADTDWVRATQAQFAPIRIAARLWIVPSWCEPADRSAINITLDPGLAFGTGSHPTTRLCLEWLADHVRGGEALLDFGCGSGILAIAAAALGADRVIGVDIDPQAIAASRANAGLNGVDATFDEPGGSTPVASETFDIVVANVLANPLVLLAPALSARVRPGGRIVLSGILAEQAEWVSAAYERWFKIAIWKAGADAWVALAGTRRDN